MQTLTATYRIVTPLFLGGANTNNHAKLREPSIKAALRFRCFVRPKSPEEKDALLREAIRSLVGKAASDEPRRKGAMS